MNTTPPALADSVNIDEGWALLEKATPGPWEWNDCDGCLVDTGKPRNWPENEPWRHEWLIDCDCPWWAPVDGSRWKRDAFQSVSEELTAEQTANARLIVYAVNNLPALLSAVAALERERDEAVKAERERCAVLRVWLLNLSANESDPNEPVADNGATVWDHIRGDARRFAESLT